MRSKPDPVDAHVGGRLRRRRTLLGLNEDAVAARLGVSFEQIQRYERGTGRIGAARLFRLSKVLGVPITYFFEGMSMEAIAASRHRAATAADEAVPKPTELRTLVRSYARLRAARVRRRIVDLIKAVASECDDG